MQRRKITLLVATSLLGVTGTSAFAQSYPDRPLRMIVPFAAAGGTDTVTRLVMKKLGEQLGQTVIIDNKPGGGGVVAHAELVRSKADGYTLTVGSAQTSLVALLHDKLPYDPAVDIVSVAPMAAVPTALVTNMATPYKTLPEMLAFARKAGATPLSYGTPGISTPHHLSGVLLGTMAGISLEHVAYRGTAPAIQDVIGGQIPLAIIGLSTALTFAKAGKVRVLGVGSATRSPYATEIPTIAEGGVPGYEASYWYDVSVAKGTPAAIVERLHAEISKAIQSPEIKDSLIKAGFEPIVMTRLENERALKDSAARWGKVIRDNKIRAVD
jgi:tripartite-type tricarboxylate transporter receptor subunit TctC